MNIKRGDMYYIIDNCKTTGSEQSAGRPAIIVSNNNCNATSPVVEVVFLTTKPKAELPTHVNVFSAARPSVAICEQVTSVAVERLGDHLGTCTDVEMASVNNALKVSLALDSKPTSVQTSATPKIDEALVLDLKTKLNETMVERDLYKSLYNGLIDRLLRS